MALWRQGRRFPACVMPCPTMAGVRQGILSSRQHLTAKTQGTRSSFPLHLGGYFFVLFNPPV